MRHPNVAAATWLELGTKESGFFTRAYASPRLTPQLIHDYFEAWGRGPNVLTPSSAANSASKNSAIHRQMSTDPEVAPRLGSRLASDALRGRKSTSREGIAA